MSYRIAVWSFVLGLLLVPIALANRQPERRHFSVYAPGSPVQMRWVKDPYNPIATVDFVQIKADGHASYMLHRAEDQFWSQLEDKDLQSTRGTRYWAFDK